MSFSTFFLVKIRALVIINSYNFSKHFLTCWMCSLILASDGWTMCPVSLTLPCTTRDSSGLSVLMPTLPVCTIDSGVEPLCQHSSASLSNWPGFEAFIERVERGWIREKKRTDYKFTTPGASRGIGKLKKKISPKKGNFRIVKFHQFYRILEYPNAKGIK